MLVGKWEAKEGLWQAKKLPRKIYFRGHLRTAKHFADWIFRIGKYVTDVSVNPWYKAVIQIESW